jgi:Asp-tRNA(Asn)/Glu-tRNA(Gln) amidotransferase A subunit family amidase
MVPLALGTQTSGSVIRPASFCGVHGFKGSWGEISYAGTKLTSGTLDTIGIYARCLDDIALYRAVLTDTRPVKLQRGNVPAPRIGVWRTPFASQAGPGSFEALEAVASAAGKAGAVVTALELPSHFGGLPDAVRWISAWEGARSLAWEKSFHRDRISPDLRYGRIADGEACSPELYTAQCRLAERCRLEFDAVFDGIDVLLTLASPGEAPLGLRETGSAVFNASFTALHAPCVTLPGHTGPNGLPIGVQLVGKRGTDRRLLDIAAWVERAAL